MTILTALRERFRPAIAALGVEPDPFMALILPASNPQFGDYQANCAMPIAKQLGKPPRAVAESLVQSLKLDDLCEPPEIAGPGFINLRLQDAAITGPLRKMVTDDRLGIPLVASPRTYVVDFSSPNVAKPMHVGHIRSTILGDALARMLRFMGHRVITDNHLGDWGTQFGMIIYGYKHFLDAVAYDRQPVAELSRLYRLVQQLTDAFDARDALPSLRTRRDELQSALTKMQNDPETALDKKRISRLKKDIADAQEELAKSQQLSDALSKNPDLATIAARHAEIRDAVLRETALLHSGDAANLAIWNQVLPACREEIQRVYQRLAITFDHELGESFYHDQLPAVVGSLYERGLATESGGAICVFLDGFDTPMLVRKRDGAFLYATSDLATIAHRAREWKPDIILYVVDARQAEHFAKLFAAAHRWGYDQIELRHVSFGSILGSDHRPFRTRAGDTVGLESLLDEAERRAYAVVCETDGKKEIGEQLDEVTRHQVATVVGIAALKYADLSQNRTSDYVFDYDKMLSLQGNTATYLQYSYARAHGIFQRGNIDIEQIRASATPVLWSNAVERELAVRLLQFGEALDEALVDYRPNLLTSYLFDLAKVYSSFFEACPVLMAETPELKHSRLQLVDLTARTLRLGLHLLGIDVVEKM